MATGVHEYKSTDASAPQLSGQAGKLTDLLDAILVNGYGALPAAGWAITFTATNKRVYRPAAGNRLYLRVHDNATGSGGAKEALIRGAESFSDVDTPTNPFPTAAQSALTDNSLIARKSNSADATARPWISFADDRTLYLAVQTGDSAATYFTWMFGDFCSTLSADAWRTILVGRATENSSAVQQGDVDSLQNSTFNTVLVGHFVARARTGAAGSLAVQKSDNPGFPATGIGCGILANLPYPNAEDGGLYEDRVFLHDVTTAPASSIRGTMRGLWAPRHAAAFFNDQDTFQGVGDLAGRSFRIIKASARGGCMAFETSDTWDTST